MPAVFCKGRWLGDGARRVWFMLSVVIPPLAIELSCLSSSTSQALLWLKSSLFSMFPPEEICKFLRTLKSGLRWEWGGEEGALMFPWPGTCWGGEAGNGKWGGGRLLWSVWSCWPALGSNSVPMVRWMSECLRVFALASRSYISWRERENMPFCLAFKRWCYMQGRAFNPRTVKMEASHRDVTLGSCGGGKQRTLGCCWWLDQLPIVFWWGELK